ncbi:hypothetical protein [Legionella adelaidensis]|nr:hypothetical protein [Legionella adelaidensis]
MTSVDARTLLVVDSDLHSSLPKHFRILEKNNLKAIASGQFSPTQLQNILKKIHAPIVIIDLRQESHGFINDIPVSWYGVKNHANKGKTSAAIAKDEENLLNVLALSEITLHQIIKKEQGHIIETRPLTVKPQKADEEKTLAKRLGIPYYRFYLADHSFPSEKQIKRLKGLLQNIPKGTWVYFHCRGGSGRSSTFLLLYDIFLNAKNESLDDMVDEHVRMGSKDLSKLPAVENYKYNLAQKRWEVIKKIYITMTTNNTFPN